MKRIVRTVRGTLRLVNDLGMTDISEFVRPEIWKELNKEQKYDLIGNETYYADVSDEQFDRCMKICNGSMVD